MQRIAAILLLLCFAGLGSGAMEHLHYLQHAHEDAINDAAALAAGQSAPVQDHNDSNCPVHALLHLPLLLMAWVPLLVCLGLLVAFLSLLQTRLNPQRIASCFDCRGPPLLAAL